MVQVEANRLTDRLTNYWNIIRKTSSVPEFSHFNPSAIDDIWQQCIIFTIQPQVAGAPPVVNFTRVGEKIRPLYTRDMTGQNVSSGQKHFQGAALIQRIGSVIVQPAPLMDQGQFVNEHHKIVKYRSCLLPFATASRVSHVLVGISWREF
jgi:hypothetical protein